MPPYRIFITGNYFRIVDFNNDIFEAHAKDVTVHKQDDDSTQYRFRNVVNWRDTKYIDIADIQDEFGAAYTLATFEAFVTTETGNTGSSTISGGVTIDNSGVETRLNALIADGAKEAKQDDVITELQAIKGNQATDTGAGPVGTETQRVHPSDEWLAAIGSAGTTGTGPEANGALTTLSDEDRLLLSGPYLTVSKWTDANGVKLEKRLLTDKATSVVTTEWRNAETDAIAVPAFPLTSESGDAIELVTFIDDTLNNGSVLVEFVRIATIDNSGVVTIASDYTSDLSAPYTVLGTAYLPGQIGTTGEIKWGIGDIVGIGTFSPSALAVSVSYSVTAVGNIATPPTITDSFANVRTLSVGNNGSFSRDQETDLMDTTPVIETFDAGDIIEINYTIIG